MNDEVDAARDAVRKHAWSEAYGLFTRADAETPGGLEPSDLELLAEAAWWSGHPDESEDAMRRAFAGYSARRDPVSAAIVAVRLSVGAMDRGAMSVSQGWIAQAERVLADSEESPAHAWLELMKIAQLIGANDPEAIIRQADRALELARAHDQPDVEAMATSLKGVGFLRSGSIEEGMALIDAATALATTGAVGPKMACDVYCVTISSCRNVADYRRAGEWIDIAERWMRRESLSGYTGVCRVHRAELSRLRGAWAQAEEEARQACEELERHHLMSDVGLAHNEVGEVRRQMGDLREAEEAYARAYEFGWDPQPGLALLHLARGESEEAWTAIERRLAKTGPTGDRQAAPDPVARSSLLPAAVEIALARGDVEFARSAADELESIAEAFPALVREAQALTARGRVALVDGEYRSAIEALDLAWRRWMELSIPYDSARARHLLGQARSAAGDEEGAKLELRAAQSVFRDLGARLDLAAVNESLGGDETRPRVTRAFMFTDIVTSTDLIGVIGDQAWEELLGWHDRILRRIFADHGGEVVRHTGDGFFVTFDDSITAVRCAIEIQRQLAEHRRDHGFSPSVRIGLHRAEATVQESDYSGQGVHVAARVASLADKDEIVISASSLPGDTPFDLTPAETVTLKGVGEPVEVRRVRW